MKGGFYMTQLEMYRNFLKNQQKIVADYLGKYVLFVDDRVVASYDSSMDAYKDAMSKYEAGTYIIQHCQAPSSVLHSRVVFANA